MTGMGSTLDYRVQPGTALVGRIRMPGDKSISHRALLLAALAEGESVLEGLSTGTDVSAMAVALQALGTRMEAGAPGCWRVHGGPFRAPDRALDLGNSGTAARLLIGALAGCPFDTVLTGDASLCRRPMRRIIAPLQAMGAQFEAAPGDTLPLTVRASAGLAGLHYRCPLPSAQLKSALLLAGLRAAGSTCVTESVQTRDHTERLLEQFAGPPSAAATRDAYGYTVCVQGGTRLRAARLQVPGDFSQAVFFIAGACLAPGSELRIERVGMNPSRTAALEVFRAMGAAIEMEGEAVLSGEPIMTLRVRHTTGLHAASIAGELAARAIDELPMLIALSACLPGCTRLRDATALRTKESDRLQSLQEGLQAVGIRVEGLPDGLNVYGAQPRGGVVHSHGDHRMVMAFTMLALAAAQPVRIVDCDWVQTSFPGFVGLARQAGMVVQEQWGQ